MNIASGPALLCLAATATLALSACSSARDDYPSLARRPAERITGSALPAASSPAPDIMAAPTPGHVAQLDQLVAQTRESQRTFTARRGAAERAAAGAGARGSESWASASLALAQLQEAHSRATAALAELDRMDAERRIAPAGNSADLATTRAARGEVEAVVGEQLAVLDRLRTRLGG